MEKRILRAAVIQSTILLIICIIAGFVLHSEIPATVQANVEDILLTDGYPNYIYVIDAGHGGIDGGTMSPDGRHEEKLINLSIANMVKEMLEEDRYTQVYMTRESDQFISPKERARIINKISPDLTVSIHCNSAENQEAEGVEVLYSSGKDSSKELSKQCLNEILKLTDQVNRGLIEGDNIYIIRNSKNPIALLEVGFLSNKRELDYLLKKKNQEKIARGIVNGIRKTERNFKGV
ncbi:N-acetylmuramoyl-L-alanine amidase family protein [[Clostridium] polysaccharolyticum]|uniref:N-acetylmuramoyl-L-alanine amidase n=1 Tax=[Clostridium] polysaccharolyticum TaxID=29364 RepID=A0A1I0FSN3_9FIRM|nr:N-acetylmuramoyl-L-alanine amidase [[Clostridium] polysaccharolyticum]SET61333.1 N-acetylmuramoyl-L-alanine amidase [[Clostridium] polysaccharolyticum]